MSRRRKSIKERKNPAMSVGAASGRETEPLYQRMFGEGDMTWLANEYRRRSESEPSLTLESFADQYNIQLRDLRNYLPELSEGKGISRSVVVWHGTSRARAKSILKEGFIPKVKKGEERRIYFTQRPAVARGYAQRRAKSERDSPAVIQCAIDLNDYRDYQRRGEGIFAFKAQRISSEVVRRVTGHKREPREKLKKQQNHSDKITDIALTFNSGRSAIAYWLNSYLGLNDDNRIPEDHAAAGKIKEWLDSQTDAGRFGEVPHEEIRGQLGNLL